MIPEANADPNVPRPPPHTTLKDAKNFMFSFASEPEMGSVLKNTAKQVIETVLPG